MDFVKNNLLLSLNVFLICIGIFLVFLIIFSSEFIFDLFVVIVVSDVFCLDGFFGFGNVNGFFDVWRGWFGGWVRRSSMVYSNGVFFRFLMIYKRKVRVVLILSNVYEYLFCLID